MPSGRATVISLLVTLLIVYASAFDGINHLQVNEAHLIETGWYNFALTTPVLQKEGWKTVYLNGNNLVTVSPQCQYSIKQFDSLDEKELDLLLEAKLHLSTIRMNKNKGLNQELDGQPVYKIGSFKYSPEGQSRGMTCNNFTLNSFYRNGASFMKYGQKNICMSRPGLPNKILLVFVDDDVATFVYKDGQVAMKPIACMEQSEETKLVEQLRQESP